MYAQSKHSPHSGKDLTVPVGRLLYRRIRTRFILPHRASGAVLLAQVDIELEFMAL